MRIKSLTNKEYKAKSSMLYGCGEPYIEELIREHYLKYGEQSFRRGWFKNKPQRSWKKFRKTQYKNY